jgi:protein O-GlcNAc transferase
VQIDPHSPAYDNLLYAINFHPDYDAHRIAREAAHWENTIKFLTPVAKTYRNDRAPDRRLRVGFVSPDFRDHTIGRFMQPLFAHHDPAQMEIAAYAEVLREDWMTQSLRRFTSIWRDTRGVDDQQLARQIDSDQIDILIDLAMHSDGSRLITFAQRPAPLQATYLAYCGSTGLHAMDYRLSDPFIDPPGGDETIYAERTIRLETFWCYTPPPGVPTPTPRALGQPVVFGCLNNFAKINTAVLTCWAEVLRRVDDSTLLIHAFEGAHRQRVLNFFTRVGIDSKRIRFIGQQKQNDYFASYSQIDIALDPFPFGGGTTTCDALWMGVPVVTLAGRTACARGGASILNQIGMPELVALRTGEYIDTAVELARDESRRNWLRSNLRDVMSQSCLMDAPRFAHNFQSLCREVWRRYCQPA